jgi:hypothetical protein
LALFVALSGTAWAATELDKNEVKSKHIGKRQVKSADLGNNSVTSPKVADRSLLGEDFAPGQLPQGAQGATGPQGPQGERGPQGEQGPPGPTLGATENVANPPPAEGFNGAVTVTTPVSGRLFVSGDAQVQTVCGNENTLIEEASVGLYVDGNPITGTNRRLNSGTGEPYHATGVTQTLSPGQHTVEFGFQCDGANNRLGSTVDPERSLSAIFLGT